MRKFGWNENPAIDFCAEVDAIEGLVADYRAGLETKETVMARIVRALFFRVGGDERAVSAKAKLRTLADSLK